MKRRVTAFLLVILLAFGTVALPCVGWGDAGDFSGDTDYGGSDWGSSDWGSSDWGSSDWGDSDDDDDWGSFGSGGSSSSGSGGGAGTTGLACLIVAVIIIVSLIRSRSKKGKSKSNAVNRTGYTPVNTGMPRTNPSVNVNEEEVLAELMKKDPNFSRAAFVEKVSNFYIQMQQAWQTKQWEPMRMHMTDALYSQMERQLAEYKRLGRTNYMERIAVLGVRIVGYTADEKNDILTLRVNTRMVDYTVDDNTGEVVNGSKKAEKFLEYEYTFIRSVDMLTPQDNAEVKIINCKNCGAPLNVNHSGQCPYCDSILTASDYDWVLYQIKGISQRTVGG